MMKMVKFRPASLVSWRHLSRHRRVAAPIRVYIVIVVLLLSAAEATCSNISKCMMFHIYIDSSQNIRSGGR